MQQSFRWSETTKGFVLSSFFAGYLLFQVPAGYLAGRYGGRRVLGFAVLWWSLFTILTPSAAKTSLPVLIAARIGMGLGEGAMFPAAYNLFARWIPLAERTRSVSILLSGIPIGTVIALCASGTVITHYGWSAVFYSFGALGLIWAALWFACIPRDSLDPANDTAHHSIPWRALFSHPAVWALIINHFCANWTLYMLLAWLPSYFHKTQGLGIASASLYSAAPWLTMVVMINVAAWLADSFIRRGISLTTVRKMMQTIGLLGSAAFLLPAQQPADAETALALMCAALGAFAFTWSGFSPNHLDIAPRQAGVLMGVTNTAGTIPGLVGVAVTGWLVDASGTYASAFMLAAAINVLGALIWLGFATGERILT